MTLGISVECHFAEGRISYCYAESCYAEYCGAVVEAP